MATGLAMLAAVAAHGYTAPAKDRPSKPEPSGFRGVLWGATEAQARQALHLSEYDCHNDYSGNGERDCESPFSIGRSPVTAHFLFRNDALGAVTLTPFAEDFNFVQSVFTEKYGRPTSIATEPTRTRMNVAYTNRVLRWRWPNVEIKFQKYGTSVTRSFVFIATTKFLEQKAAADVMAHRDGVRALEESPPPPQAATSDAQHWRDTIRVTAIPDSPPIWDTAPLLLSRVEPEYPAIARKARVGGIVRLRLTINDRGAVDAVRVLKSLPFGLDDAAVAAAKQWTFEPAKLGGRALWSSAEYDVTFDSSKAR